MRRIPYSGPPLSAKLVPNLIRDAWVAAHRGIGELPESYEAARKHKVGDALADFLIIELFESHDGEDLTDEKNATKAMLDLIEKTKLELTAFESHIVQKIMEAEQ